MTHEYGVRDVEKLLRLPRSTIRALIDAGFVTPARGVRNAWRFSFQDLIVLRTAQALARAQVPHRRKAGRKQWQGDIVSSRQFNAESNKRPWLEQPRRIAQSHRDEPRVRWPDGAA